VTGEKASAVEAHFDVAIAGGGPSGAATARALRRHAPELSVLLVEASAYDAPRVGETLAPPALRLLDQLGLADPFRALAPLQAPGTLSTWGLADGQEGGEDRVGSHRGAAWHLDRRAFDAWLADAAEEASAEVRRQTRVTGCHRAPGGWHLQLQGEDGRREVHASVVVDATGRRAAIAGRIGKESASRVLFDDQVAVYAFFQGGSRDQRTLIEPIADGWFYASRLPDQRLAVALFTDGDLAKQQNLRDPETFRAATRETRHLAAWLEGAELVAGPDIHAAGACHLSPVAGKGWLAVGDAAFCLDPLAGQGLVKALANAFRAAYAAADLLRGLPGTVDRYQRTVLADVEPFLDTRDTYHRQERRWPNFPYWQRRQQAISLDPRQLLRRHPDAGPTRYARHLAPNDLAALLETAEQAKPAHQLAAALKQRNPHLSDRRLVLVIQHLVADGLLEVLAT
jgi:flavin-dependent dehydrogenase